MFNSALLAFVSLNYYPLTMQSYRCALAVIRVRQANGNQLTVFLIRSTPRTAPLPPRAEGTPHTSIWSGQGVSKPRPDEPRRDATTTTQRSPNHTVIRNVLVLRHEGLDILELLGAAVIHGKKQFNSCDGVGRVRLQHLFLPPSLPPSLSLSLSRRTNKTRK